MTSSHQNVVLSFLSDCGILQFTPSLRSEQNGTELLLKYYIPVTTFYVRNSPILF